MYIGRIEEKSAVEEFITIVYLQINFADDTFVKTVKTYTRRHSIRTPILQRINTLKSSKQNSQHSNLTSNSTFLLDPIYTHTHKHTRRTRVNSATIYLLTYARAHGLARRRVASPARQYQLPLYIYTREQTGEGTKCLPFNYIDGRHFDFPRRRGGKGPREHRRRTHGKQMRALSLPDISGDRVITISNYRTNHIRECKHEVHLFARADTVSIEALPLPAARLKIPV